MQPGRFRLTFSGGPDDGVVLDQRAAVVVVANLGLFGGGMRICPDASPDDGLLDVCLVGDVGRLALLRAFPKVRTGAHLDHSDVTIHRASEVHLETDTADPTVRADGEPFTRLPLTVTVRPGSLLVAGAGCHPPGRAPARFRHPRLGSES
jgi:diacylglycerol kinase (ATP)